MSTTTAAILLMTADRLARDLTLTHQPISRTRWETFDHTVHRCLHTLLGPGRRPTGHDTPAAAAAIRAFAQYPSPLKPASGNHTQSQAAALLGTSIYHVRRDILSGALRAERVDREYRIASEDLDTRPDLAPADPRDDHPLASLSVALGAMTDLVAGHRVDYGAALTDDAEIAAAMRQVLAMTVVAARHTLAHCPISDANRPLAVGQYATRAIDTLEARSNYPQLWAVTSSSPPPQPRTPNDRLETALRQWHAAARSDLKHHIPSTDVIRNIANQGIHILAVTHALIAEPPGEACEPFAARGGRTLHEVATHLQSCETAWAPFTTAMPPSHSYVTASRAAFTALNDIASTGPSTPPRNGSRSEIDADRMLLDLAIAVRDLDSLLKTVQDVPQRLIDSELLFVRARTVAPRTDLLEARSHGHLVVARPQDGPDLVSSTRRAAELARTVADPLFCRVAQRGSRRLAAESVGAGPLL